SPAEELVLQGSFVPRHKEQQPKSEERRFGDFIYQHRGAESVRLVCYDGCATQLDIPSQIDGRAVTSLATNLFRDHTELREVSIPDSIAYAGHHVFDGCTQLKRVRLSASLDEIEPTMFRGCSALTDVELSAPIVRLGGSLFLDSPVEEIIFGPAVRALDPKPCDLPHLKRIRVVEAHELFATDGKALLSADGQRFYRLVVPCASYAVPEGCLAIEERAFDSCGELEAVVLPDSVQIIGRLAFAKTGLSTLRIPPKTEVIGEKAFFHCTNLSSVVLPGSLREIAREAFAFSGIRRVQIPSSLQYLGFRAFKRTPAQRHVHEGCIQIAAGSCLDLDGEGGLYRHDVFVELIGLVERYCVRRGTHVIGDEAFGRHETIRFVEVPEGVFSVGTEAFRGNRQLARVDLPQSLERIGDRAFLDTALETLYLSRNVR
ncbi:MAG: leucine-rich repeat protein, partial [Raoultibacter sp.]